MGRVLKLKRIDRYAAKALLLKQTDVDSEAVVEGKGKMMIGPAKSPDEPGVYKGNSFPCYSVVRSAFPMRRCNTHTLACE